MLRVCRPVVLDGRTAKPARPEVGAEESAPCARLLEAALRDALHAPPRVVEARPRASAEFQRGLPEEHREEMDAVLMELMKG
jgi:hypothetical protein